MADVQQTRWSPLPDREQRHLLQFYLVPSWTYGRRLAVAGALILVGLVIQLAWQPDSPTVVLLVTMPVIFAGVLLLLNRGFDTKPPEVRSTDEWEKTTLDRFREVRELEKKTRSWDETVVDLTCATGVIVLIVIALVTWGVYVWLLDDMHTQRWAPIFLADTITMILPLWITGTRRGWKPETLRQQVDALQVALDTIALYSEPACQIQPMFEMAGTKRKTPLAARVFVRFPDGPEDYYGLQFQVALNNVQGTKYPYLYAVLVARKSFKLIERFCDPFSRIADKNLIIETSIEQDVDVLVIRQKTTKTKGYHTKPPAVRQITGFAWQCCKLITEHA